MYEEIDNERPDFKCRKCRTGVSVFPETITHNDYDFDIDCPKCGTRLYIRMFVTLQYSVRDERTKKYGIII